MYNFLYIIFYFTFISYLIHTFPFILSHSGQHSTHIPHEVREIWNAMKIHKMQLQTNLKKLQRMEKI